MAISVEIPDAETGTEVSVPLTPTIVHPEDAVGIDLGITTLATLSTGEMFPNPNALEKKLKYLKRLSRSLSRKQPRSKNRHKAKQKSASSIRASPI